MDSGSPVWTTPATTGSPAGSYAIDGGGLTATNYVFIEAPGNASALTLQASGPVTPPGPGITSALALARNAAGTLEADLPELAVSEGPESGPGNTDSGIDRGDVADDTVAMDKRVASDAHAPSLRIVRGGVKMPVNLVDVNAR